MGKKPASDLKLVLDQVTPAAAEEESDAGLLNTHRHLHGQAALGRADCARLAEAHAVLVAEMERRGLAHDSPLDCPEPEGDSKQDAPGLCLPRPHGFLVWKGKETAVARCKAFADFWGEQVVDRPLVVVSGGEAYGVAVLGKPAEMALTEFDRVEWGERHKVRPEERRQWWPDAETLCVYPVKSFRPFDQPRPVVTELGDERADLVAPVRYKEYRPPSERERRILAASEKLPKQIVLTPRAVSLTGSMLYGRKHEPRDMDFVVVGAEWRPDEGQFVVPLTPTFREKLERAMKAVYQTGNSIQYISEGTGPTFDHLPLYALCLVRLPRLEIERVSEMEQDFAALCYDKPESGVKAMTAAAVERKLRGASAAIRKQALATYREDKVVPGRMVLSLKPLRPAPAGQRQTLDVFLAYVEEHLEFPLYVSVKRDGATVYAHGDGERVWFYSDDGEDNTQKLPGLRDYLKKKYKGKSFVFGCELELWRDKKHYPREATIGAVHRGEDADLALNVFRAVYWDGRDLHAEPFEQVWKLMQDVPADTRTDGALDPQGDGPVNIVPHYQVNSLDELADKIKQIAYKPGVEGVVVARADGTFPLDGEPGDPPTEIKFHKSFPVVVEIMSKTETKTAGVYVYAYRIGGLKGGKTFGSALKLQPGDAALLEGEQLNLERDEAGEVAGVSVWAPELIEASKEKPEALETVVERARRHGVLREKVRREGGEVEYLPNDAGEPETADKAQLICHPPGIEHWVPDESPDATLTVTEGPILRVGTEAEKQNILLSYPDEDKTWRFVAQEHFRGKSAHLDLRFEAGDYLVGWTVPNQQPGAIQEPVETLAAARAALKDAGLWKMDMATGEIKPRQTRGGERQRGNLRAFPKGTEIPEAWLKVEGVTEEADPGEEPPAGATRNFPGVFAIAETGTVEFGAQKTWAHEYFIHGEKWGDQRWLFRLLGRKADEPLPEGVEDEDAREGTYFVWMQPLDATPYVLTKGAVDEGWLPPRDVSALPKRIRDKVPKDMRYWETSGKAALERRARLVEEMDVRELAGTELKADGWHEYVLQRHTWRGPVQIRFGPSEEHYDLRVALDGRHWHLVVDGDPLTQDRLPAYEETQYSGEVATADGKRIGVLKIGTEPLELAPGQPANPTKDTPAFLQRVDEGQARFLSDLPEFKKMEFKGGKLEGVWAFRLEEAGSEIGEFGREEAGPATKGGPPPGEEIAMDKYVYGCKACDKEFESDVALVEPLCPDCVPAYTDAEPAAVEEADVPPDADGEKAGRRLRGEKVGLVQEIKDTLLSLGEKLTDLLRWAAYEDEGGEAAAPAATWLDLFKQAEAGLAIKDVGGEPWLITWSANAFKDRQDEIFTTHALESWASGVEGLPVKGYYNWWHIWGSDFAEKRWVGVPGRFLVEAGPFLKDARGRAALEFFKTYPNGHPDLAPEGWGCSVEYRYLPEERKSGVYQTVAFPRTSVLPRFAAANVWTKAGVTMALTDEQKKSAVNVFGEDLARQIIDAAETKTKDLEEAGVAHKAEGSGEPPAAEAPPAEPPAEDDKAKQEKKLDEGQVDQYAASLKECAAELEGEAADEVKSLAEGLTDSNVQDRGKRLAELAGTLPESKTKGRLKKVAASMAAGEEYPAPQQYPAPKQLEPAAFDVKALAEDVAEVLRKQFTVDFAPLVDGMGELAKALDEVRSRLEKLEQGEATKAKTELPRFELFLKRASAAEKTVVEDGDPLGAKKPVMDTTGRKDKSGASAFFGPVQPRRS